MISGDRGGSSQLETFNALFPRGNYFGESALVGPANLLSIDPMILWKLGRLEIEAGWDFYWRDETTDGLYGPGGNLIVSGDASDARQIGDEISLVVGYEASRHVSLGVGLSRFRAGDFLEAADRDDTDYAMAFTTFKF